MKSLLGSLRCKENIISQDTYLLAFVLTRNNNLLIYTFEKNLQTAVKSLKVTIAAYENADVEFGNSHASASALESQITINSE